METLLLQAQHASPCLYWTLSSFPFSLRKVSVIPAVDLFALSTKNSFLSAVEPRISALGALQFRKQPGNWPAVCTLLNSRICRSPLLHCAQGHRLGSSGMAHWADWGSCSFKNQTENKKKTLSKSLLWAERCRVLTLCHPLQPSKP